MDRETAGLTRLKGMIPPRVRLFAACLGLMMVSMSIFRLVFLAVNWPLFDHYGVRRLAVSLLLGLRFDLHVCLLILAPFVIFLFLSGPLGGNSAVRKVLVWLPAAVFLAAAAIPFIDFHFYSEAGRHLAYEIMDMGGNTGDLVSSIRMIAAYKGYISGFVLFTALFILALRWLAKRAWEPGEHHSLVSRSLWTLVCLFFLALGIRGTLGAKPLKVGHAFSQGEVALGHLVLNPAYTVGNTLLHGGGRIPGYFSGRESARIVRGLLAQDGVTFTGDRYPAYRRQVPPAEAPPSPVNLVLIVMEGWTGEFMGAMGAEHSQTPYFDRMARDGLLFDHFVANGGRSLEAMTSILLGLPPYRDFDVQSGALAQDSFRGLAALLGDKGYSSLFIHGGKVGTLGLDAFAGVTGFDRYLGMEDLPTEPGDYDGVWGVYDHVMARHLDRELSAMEQPFFALWFTLSSHNPFLVPDDTFRVNPPEAEMAPFLDSLHYSDYSIHSFFQLAAGRDYFKDTIFVLVGDHTAGPGLDTVWKRHRVPLLIYAPGRVKPGLDHDIADQMDLIPTLMDLVGIEAEHHAMGGSLLREGERFAMALVGGGYAWFTGEDSFVVDADGRLVSGDSVPEADLGRARAFLQLTKTLLRDNRLAPLAR